MEHNQLTEWFKNELARDLDDSELWRLSEDDSLLETSGTGMRYIADDKGIVCFMYDEINLFVVDKNGNIRWMSPASNLDDEPVRYSNETIVEFLKKHEFEVMESDSGLILAKAPFGL